jgi:hypothetical protein
MHSARRELFRLGSRTKFLYVFLRLSFHACYIPAHCIILDFITIEIIVEEHPRSLFFPFTRITCLHNFGC